VEKKRFVGTLEEKTAVENPTGSGVFFKK